MLLNFFSERKFTYQEINKFCMEFYVINSICMYHCASCFSIALITYSQKLSLFYIPQVCNDDTSGERRRERERKTLLFFLCFLIVFICKKGEVSALVTTWGSVQKHPWAVSTGEMSWQK